ncbi:MAG: aminoglycoside phosphotransferase family protein [Propionibacteriaceae bacterium]|nr:aminoglycoside phosphotransferase family protein [Propionibacteriaceae bacterium]
MLSDHAAIIACAYGGGCPVQDMVVAARGEHGRVWRLVTADGALAIKELIIRQVRAGATADVAYQEAVLATGLVPMPRPVRTSADEILFEVAGHQVRAYEWVDLLPVDTTLDPAVMGATLAAVHLVRHTPARPVHGWYTDPVGALRWTHLLDDARAAGAPFAEALEAEIPHLLRLETLIEPPMNLQSCHRDLWADNIRPTPAGGVCVIDWENCGLADPAHEIPMVLVDFGGGDPRRVGLLYQSYVDAGGPARISGYGCFTMVIVQFGHFWESAVKVFTSPNTTEEGKAHNLDRMAELLDLPLRVEYLEELLDTVAAVH